MTEIEKKVNIICDKINELLKKKDKVIIAIDGRCASGKTTLANKLSEIYDCNVFHMDDFFLRPEQRTKERLGMPGENVDYERFREEVLKPVLEGKDFAYRPFDCKSFGYKKAVNVKMKKINIVEGSYSMHPSLEFAYDFSVFSDISPQKQKKRIKKRNKDNSKVFFEMWIPLEERYFAEMNVRERCDIL